MITRVRAATAAALLCASGATAVAKSARPAPPLDAPAGAIVTVRSEPELQRAVDQLASNTTILIAPGVYRLTRTLYVKGPLTNVSLRGATDNSDDVVIAGLGMTNASYGNVPYGIWTGDGVDGITIANVTIRDYYYHPIIFNAGTSRPRIYNVRLVDAGEQFIKVNPDARGDGVHHGVLEYSIIEFTTVARNGYPKGIDIHGAEGWNIRHNLFRNLVAAREIAGPAILAWRGTRDTIVEGNTFINCARGVMFGADDHVQPSHRGGLIRNNVFYRSRNQPGDVGIILSSSPGTKVLNNTILLSGTYSAAIEYRYARTNGGTIANNLVDAAIRSRDGGSATLVTNVSGAPPTMFVDAAAGNLHLTNGSAAAINRATRFSEVVDDWDGRPRGASPDVGADELDP